jgi:heme-binding NEAT domain protein
MSIVLGLNAKLYRGTAGTKASTEVNNVKDLTVTLESGEADVTTRATQGWKASMATLKEASLEFTILYDTADTDFNAFQTAYFSNTPLALYVSDGDSTTEKGLDADFTITGFSVEQNLEEAITVSITAKPTQIGGSSSRAPKWA